jgi:hypothetical protein
MAVYITWIRRAAICAPLLVTAAPALAQTRIPGHADCYASGDFLRQLEQSAGRMQRVFTDGTGSYWITVEYPDGSGSLGFIYQERGLICIVAARAPQRIDLQPPH